MQRESLGSRLGFILLSAGCAIGIGNVWKFPYLAGQNGGGAFVLVYLIFLLVLGVPVMTMEFAMGRASQKSPVKMYQQLERPGQKWHIHGYVALSANFLLLMCYTTISGWMLKYFVDTAAGKFEGQTTAGLQALFGEMMNDPLSMGIYAAITLVLSGAVCAIGLKKGLERVTKVMMLALLAIMVVLAGNSLFLEGGAEGLKFYLIPDFGRMQKAGFGNVIVAAMNQSFFTLSLGIGSMAIFGSYIGKERALMGESIRVAVLDTFVAISSGLIIFPACFAYGVEPDSGPDLLFITLPNIFNHLPWGRLWGSLFFIFMSFAALSTVLAVFENIVSCVMDLTTWSRRKTCLICAIALILLSMPCVLGLNVLSFITPFGEGSSIMDLEDFIVNNLMLPVGSLLFLLFCVSRYGWGWNNFTNDANQGKGMKVARWMRGYMTYVLPVIILVVFVVGLVQKFVI